LLKKFIPSCFISVSDPHLLYADPTFDTGMISALDPDLALETNADPNLAIKMADFFLQVGRKLPGTGTR
jgi:hypothetical protein